MYSLDTTTKKKNRTTPYIIVAVAAVLVAGVAIWGNNTTGTKKSVVAELSDKMEEEKQVLRNDVVLHDHFRKLQELDEKYSMLLMNAAPQSQVDSAARAILAEEKGMKGSIDSISAESVKFNAWANVVMSDSIISSFRKALANRQYMAVLRSAIGGKPIAINNSDKELMQLQFDVQKKDERIASLEKELKQKPVTAAPATEEIKPEKSDNSTQLQKDNEDLQSQLKEEEIRNTGLLDLTHTLKADNEKLLAEISKVHRNNAADDASAQAATTKLASLQDQIDDLNAELNFANVDCNLTRADAKKIISNSRQRKELLAQALKSLQDLSRSDNASVQRRAKEKLGELSQIASTVRD